MRVSAGERTASSVATHNCVAYSTAGCPPVIKHPVLVYIFGASLYILWAGFASGWTFWHSGYISPQPSPTNTFESRWSKVDGLTYELVSAPYTSGFNLAQWRDKLSHHKRTHNTFYFVTILAVICSCSNYIYSKFEECNSRHGGTRGDKFNLVEANSNRKYSANTGSLKWG